MRVAVVATVLSLSVIGLSSAEEAAAAIRRPVQISAQPLGSALQSFASTQEIHVMFVSGDVANLRTVAVAGNLTAEETLTLLLRGTGLTFRYLDSKTVSILPVNSGTGVQGQPPAAAPKTSKSSDAPVTDNARFRVAQVDVGEPASTSSTAREVAQNKLEEVVVTGSRIERTGDGPRQVYTYSRQDIDNSGQQRSPVS